MAEFRKLMTQDRLLAFERLLEDGIDETLFGHPPDSKDKEAWNRYAQGVDLLEPALEAFKSSVCEALGCAPVINDYCMRPKCDHCAFCGKSMPGEAPREQD